MSGVVGSHNVVFHLFHDVLMLINYVQSIIDHNHVVRINFLMLGVERKY